MLVITFACKLSPRRGIAGHESYKWIYKGIHVGSCEYKLIFFFCLHKSYKGKNTRVMHIHALLFSLCQIILLKFLYLSCDPCAYSSRFIYFARRLSDISGYY